MGQRAGRQPSPSLRLTQQLQPAGLNSYQGNPLSRAMVGYAVSTVGPHLVRAFPAAHLGLTELVLRCGGRPRVMGMNPRLQCGQGYPAIGFLGPFSFRLDLNAGWPMFQDDRSFPLVAYRP